MAMLTIFAPPIAPVTGVAAGRQDDQRGAAIGAVILPVQLLCPITVTVALNCPIPSGSPTGVPINVA